MYFSIISEPKYLAYVNFLFVIFSVLAGVSKCYIYNFCVKAFAGS
jgi:hypothetical protein